MRYMENEQHNQSKKNSELNLYISDITCVDKKLCCANYEQHGENPTGPKLPTTLHWNVSKTKYLCWDIYM
jgi:hypothetical protein